MHDSNNQIEYVLDKMGISYILGIHFVCFYNNKIFHIYSYLNVSSLEEKIRHFVIFFPLFLL
jgi:hypothetical protein